MYIGLRYPKDRSKRKHRKHGSSKPAKDDRDPDHAKPCEFQIVSFLSVFYAGFFMHFT